MREGKSKILEHSVRTGRGRTEKAVGHLLCVTKRLLLATLPQGKMAKNLCRSTILLLALK